MSTRATATFEITGWEETAYDDTGDGPKRSRATVQKTFRGGVAAESRAEPLMCQAEGGSGYVASERIVDRLGDRAGSFVVQHGANGGADESRAFGAVVPGSGTGELRGLRGRVTYQYDQHGANFTLDYDLA